MILGARSSQSCSLQVLPLRSRSLLKAGAVWRWYRSLLRLVPPGKRVLRVNMDETSVAAFHGHERGNVIRWQKRGRDAEPEPITWADRKRRRTAFTHAAFICDDTAIQPLLPQLLLANESCLTKRDLDTILEDCPPNVYVKRAKSGWMTSEILLILMKCLVEVLRPYSETHQVFFMLDAARCHLHDSIAQYCARNQIFLIVVPARLTFLLQPCDTHLFARYKVHLKKRYHEVASEAADGTVDTVSLFRCVFHTIRAVMQGRSWHSAFEADGYSDDVTRVSSYIMRSLQYENPPMIADGMPDEALFMLCYPRNSKPPCTALLRPFRTRALQLSLAPDPGRALALPAPSISSAAAQRPRGVRLLLRALPAPGGHSATSGSGASSSHLPWPGLRAAMARPVSPPMHPRMREATGSPEEESQAMSQGVSHQSPGSASGLPWTLRSRR